MVKTSKTTGIFQTDGMPLPYCRYVDRDSFFFSVVFCYFEELCKPENSSLVEDCERRIICKKKFKDHDFPIKEFRQFLHSPSQEILEILKNNFGLFLRYKKKLCFYYSKKHPDKYSKFPETYIKDSSQPMQFSTSLCELLAKVTKLKIKCHYFDKPFNIFTAKNSKQGDPCINIYLKGENKYCILYEKSSLITPDLVINDPKNVLRYPTETTSQPEENCRICRDRCSNPEHKGSLITSTPKNSENFPIERNSTVKCNQCQILKQPKNLYSGLCHNCTVLNALSGNNLNPDQSPKISCQSCPSTRFLCPEDFMPIPCPDNHDFLCKACWTKSLQLDPRYSISEKKSRLKCPLNNMKINLLSHYIFNILKIKCKRCGIKNSKYFGNKVCKMNCEICFTCQTEANNKCENNFSCLGCNNVLTDKSGPWVESHFLKDVIGVE